MIFMLDEPRHGPVGHLELQPSWRLTFRPGSRPSTAFFISRLPRPRPSAIRRFPQASRDAAEA
jgi:hypothetical protein